MTLYLKYRPQTINELDLESVRDSLTKILGAQNLPHAYLFSGPKGTGKTSAARILAKIINCQDKNKPCNKCDQCLSITKGSNMDVIELDAASNRGIDDIRSLKENIMLAPVAAKKKIYIIDEAHMLTTEASNAFLKTLEEPPAHVMFILATTNPEKLPETVISRLTRVDFSKAGSRDIARQIERVAEGEKLKITDGAVEIIAKRSDGSFRDAVKILESLILYTQDIKEKDVENLLHADRKTQTVFFEFLKKGNTKNVLEIIEKNIENGVSPKLFLNEITEVIHESLLAKNTTGEDSLPDYSLEELINLAGLLHAALPQISISPVPELPLEIALMKFISSNSEVTQNETIESTPEPKEVSTKTLTSSPVLPENWQRILQTVGMRNASIEGLLRAAQPLGVNDRTLTIGVYYRFHKEKLESPPIKKILEEVICQIIDDKNMHIDFLLTEKKPAQHQPSEPLTPKVDADIISAAKEIFGN